MLEPLSHQLTDGSVVPTRARSQNEYLNEQLFDFTYNADCMLHCGDRNQINYSKAEILSWTLACSGGLPHLLHNGTIRYLWRHRWIKDQKSLTKFDFGAERRITIDRDLDDLPTGGGFT